MTDYYGRTNNICLVFLTIFATALALIYMKPVLIPLVFSIFAYSLLTPLVTFIKKKARVPKSIAIFLSLVLLFFLLALIVLILIHSIENFIEGVPKYKESLNESLIFVENKLASLHIDFPLSKMQELIQTLPLFSYAQTLTGQLFYFLGHLLLVFIFTIFMMTGEFRQNYKNKFLSEVLQKISIYLSIKFSMSVLTGFFVWLVLLSFGVELAAIFGFLTVLFNFIPTIGSLMAIVLPLPVVFLQYQFGWPFFAVLALSGSIQFCVGNIIEPKTLGGSLDLHPISVLICLIFWGMIWGIAGMFLAVPITAVLKIVFERIEATQMLAEILAGRFSPKPKEI